MPSPLVCPALILAIAGGFFASVKDPDYAGVWSTSCDSLLDNGLRYVYSATETLRSDGSFEVRSAFCTYLPESGQLVTFGSSLDSGTWRADGGRLEKRYTRVDLEEFQSALPRLGRQEFQQELEQLIQKPYHYTPRCVTGQRIVVRESESRIVYEMQRID